MATTRRGKPRALPKQETTPATSSSDEATDPPVLEPTEFLIRLIFNVDGKAAFNSEFTGYLPHPDAIPAGQRAEFHLGVDGRQVAQLLEQHLGPSPASVIPMRPRLVAPPSQQPLILPPAARRSRND